MEKVYTEAPQTIRRLEDERAENISQISQLQTKAEKQESMVADLEEQLDTASQQFKTFKQT